MESYNEIFTWFENFIKYSGVKNIIINRDDPYFKNFFKLSKYEQECIISSLSYLEYDIDIEYCKNKFNNKSIIGKILNLFSRNSKKIYEIKISKWNT